MNFDNHFICDLEEKELYIDYVEGVTSSMNVYVENLNQVYDLEILEKENGIFEYNNNKLLRLTQDAKIPHTAIDPIINKMSVKG